MRVLIICLFGIGLIACGNDSELLYGNWRGTSAEQGGDSLHLDPTEVSFHFSPEGTYRFTSTLAYHEAGTWRREGNRLMAIDTTHTDTEQVERIVAIEFLTADSLQLRWNNDGADLVLELIRE